MCCEGVRGGTVAVVDSAKDVLNVEFTPDAGFAGVGGFSYVADDQNGHSVAGSVEITVQPPANTAPTAVDGTAEAEAGVTTPISLAQFVTDPDLVVGDQLTFEIDGGNAPVARSGDSIVATPPIEGAGRTYDVGYTRDRLGRRAGVGQGHRHGDRAERRRRRPPWPTRPAPRRARACRYRYWRTTSTPSAAA